MRPVIKIAAFLTFLTMLLAATAVLAQPPPSPTYYGSAFRVPVPIGTTDVLCLEGAAGKVIKLAAGSITGTGTSANVDLMVIRRTTLTTGGIATAVPIARGNPTHGAPVATMRLFRGATTQGTPDPGGAIFSRLRWPLSDTPSSPSNPSVLAQIAVNPYTSQPEIRNAGHALCLSFAPATAQDIEIDVNLVWTETEN